MLRNKLKNKAGQKPCTTNPEIKIPATLIIATFITRRKMPKVSMVIGMVKNTRIGLTKVLSRPTTAATKSALKKLSTAIPGIM